jgi:hypothetical protein
MTLRSFAFMILMIGFLGVFAGCGPQDAAPVPPPDSAACKKTLQDVASAGQLSSSLTVIAKYIEELKAKDPALAAVLKEDYDKLTVAQEPGAIKEIAERMSAKL